MTIFTLLPFAAAALSLALGVAGVLRKEPTPATWLFFAGMAILSLDSLSTGLSLLAIDVADALRWLTLGLVIKSFVPAAWIGFSLTYSRGDYRAAIRRWRLPLLALTILPVGLSLGFRSQLIEVAAVGPEAVGLQLRFSAAARVLNALLLLSFALVLMNLEQTFRSAVGTMRWRVKFVVMGLGAIFGGHLFVRSQAILFSTHDVALAGIESSALVVGGVFLAVAYARTGFAEAEVYPSRAVLRSSLTILVVGGYLFIVGILAQVARRFGGAESFQLQAFIVLLGLSGMALLLLSDRFRQRVQAFVGRHFRKAHHDSVMIWSGLSQRMGRVTEETNLCTSAARFVSETFDAMSVTVWLLDDRRGQLSAAASTARQQGGPASDAQSGATTDAIAAGLRGRAAPFELEAVDEAWASALLDLNPATFPEKGGNRWCVPLTSGDQSVGAIVLADRVNGAVYTAEELELLKCIGDQVTSVLLNFRLASELVRSRELEAFRTMSAFFVHDLKNAASSLNLTLKNLPVHFDNPAFRDDALRAVGNTARRIDEMIARLSELRRRPEFRPEDTDINQLVREAVSTLSDMPRLDVVLDLRPVPLVVADRDQIRSVLTNLLLNARDAISGEGRIIVRTDSKGGRLALSVADTGCGMSPAFVRDSLFRPFRSTKKDGLGIGVFQARTIIEAHGGSILVESEPGRGTTFRVNLPGKVGT